VLPVLGALEEQAPRGSYLQKTRLQLPEADAPVLEKRLNRRWQPSLGHLHRSQAEGHAPFWHC
jgi:hypothetical protein